MVSNDLPVPVHVRVHAGRDAFMASNPFNLSVGSPVWMFSSGDSPTPFNITGTTSRSWIVSRHGWTVKIPKNHADPIFSVNPTGVGCTQFFCLTRTAADRMMLERARWVMVQRVKDCTDIATLRKVAEALGMPVSVSAGGEGA